MRRLFTFGCSYTKYYWPTWAEYLALNFDYFENWGKPGLGNQAIIERIAECDARNKFTADDVVVVQWSSHLRHDWYHIHDMPENRPKGWKTHGSIFSMYNKKIFDKDWIDMFFYEPAYIMHTLNAIKLAQTYLKSSGVEWYMTSIGEIRNLGRDLSMPLVYGEIIKGAPAKKTDTDEFPIWVENPQYRFYEQTIWNDHADRWLSPLNTFAFEHPEVVWWFDDEKGEKWCDSHPSSTAHALWIEKQMCGKLNLSTDTIIEINKIVDSIEALRQDSKWYFEFCDKLGPYKENVAFTHPDKFIWPPKNEGF
jgi:hypothetical protein